MSYNWLYAANIVKTMYKAKKNANYFLLFRFNKYRKEAICNILNMLIIQYFSNRSKKQADLFEIYCKFTVDLK